MELKEKDIEDIIYSSPWLIDERFVIPNIRGKDNQVGRQVNIGGSRINRYIDLLFKDTRDNRPVIIELKRGELLRENIAQILEYKALVISMEEITKTDWEREFGRNYYCPKLILIGSHASDEIRVSANLAGVEIRELVGEHELYIDFNSIEEITQRLREWDSFLKSGNRTINDRDEWVKEIYDLLEETVEEQDDDKIHLKKLYITSSKDSWIEGITVPFINIPIFYDDRYLCGLYEYFDEILGFSSEYIYFDFMIQGIYYSNFDDEQLVKIIEEKANKALLNKGYETIRNEEGIATIKITRGILEDRGKFKQKVRELIEAAVLFNNEINETYTKE